MLLVKHDEMQCVCYLFLIDKLVHTFSITLHCLRKENMFSRTVLVIIKLTTFSVAVRFRCGCSKLTFVFISLFFAMFKNVAHSLEPGETPRTLYIV